MHLGATATLRDTFPTTYQMNKARTFLYTPHTSTKQPNNQPNKDKHPSLPSLGLSLFSLCLGFELGEVSAKDGDDSGLLLLDGPVQGSVAVI
jgi:hypothetical protein